MIIFRLSDLRTFLISLLPNDMSNNLAIKVTMLLFGELRERFGTGSIEVTLPSGSTPSDLARRFELDDSLGAGVRVAVDGIIGASADAELSDGSEVAFLPPSSGG